MLASIIVDDSFYFFVSCEIYFCTLWKLWHLSRIGFNCRWLSIFVPCEIGKADITIDLNSIVLFLNCDSYFWCQTCCKGTHDRTWCCCGAHFFLWQCVVCGNGHMLLTVFLSLVGNRQLFYYKWNENSIGMAVYIIAIQNLPCNSRCSNHGL